MLWYANYVSIKLPLKKSPPRFPIPVIARMIHPFMQDRYLPWQILSLLSFSVHNRFLPISSLTYFSRLFRPPFFYHHHPSSILPNLLPEIFTSQVIENSASILICSLIYSSPNCQSNPSKMKTNFNLINFFLLKQTSHKSGQILRV